LEDAEKYLYREKWVPITALYRLSIGHCLQSLQYSQRTAALTPSNIKIMSTSTSTIT
jgi:hypothetical protein